MSKQRNWVVGMLIVGLLAYGQPTTAQQGEMSVVDAFKKRVGHYFTLLATKDPSLTNFFENIVSEPFRYERGEMLYDKNAWLAYLHEYLIDDATRIRYEYEVQLVDLSRPDRAIIRLKAMEIRLWNDVNGMFGPVNHILEYREPFEMDVVLIREKGEWRWNQVIFYGIGKREFEQSAK